MAHLNRYSLHNEDHAYRPIYKCHWIVRKFIKLISLLDRNFLKQVLYSPNWCFGYHITSTFMMSNTKFQVFSRSSGNVKYIGDNNQISSDVPGKLNCCFKSLTLQRTFLGNLDLSVQQDWMYFENRSDRVAFPCCKITFSWHHLSDLTNITSIRYHFKISLSQFWYVHKLIRYHSQQS